MQLTKWQFFFLNLFVISILSCSPIAILQAQQLSPQANISLLTCSPGDEIYSLFGHSAVRVQDAVNNIDWVYNYGTFDFDTPNFYVKFLKGKLMYNMSIAKFEKFKLAYIYEKRAVDEQILALTPEQRQNVFDFLQNNYKPENRYYRYDFFFDNCSTRIRDIFNNALNNELIYKQVQDTTANQQTATFRELLDPYLQKSPWADFGISLILGLPTDRQATTAEHMFLPDHLMSGMDDAKLRPSKSLIQTTKNLVPLRKEADQLATVSLQLITPKVLFWSLLLLVTLFTYSNIRKGRSGRAFDLPFFLLTGLAGCLFLFMWLGTEHIATNKNLNMLWAIPLHFPLTFFLFRKSRPTFVRYYFLITAIAMIVLLFAWQLLPQQLPNTAIPIVLIALIRSIYIFYNKQI